jgi:hypothetical protein
VSIVLHGPHTKSRWRRHWQPAVTTTCRQHLTEQCGPTRPLVDFVVIVSWSMVLVVAGGVTRLWCGNGDVSISYAHPCPSVSSGAPPLSPLPRRHWSAVSVQRPWRLHCRWGADSLSPGHTTCCTARRRTHTHASDATRQRRWSRTEKRTAAGGPCVRRRNVPSCLVHTTRGGFHHHSLHIRP